MSSGGLRNCTSAVPCTAEVGETTVSTAASPGPAAPRTSGGTGRADLPDRPERHPAGTPAKTRSGPRPARLPSPCPVRSVLGLRPYDLRHAAVSL